MATTRGRKTLPQAEIVGPTFVGKTPPDMAAQELAVRLADDAANQKLMALAHTLGYDGSLTVGALEDEIRFYQRRSVEALLESGKRLLLLREVCPRGEFDQRVELLGFSRRTAYRFMQAATKTAKSANLALLGTQVKSASAFLELVTHDEDTLENLAEMDNIDRMSASQLREALRQSQKDAEFEAEKRAKAEGRADEAEKKLRGKRPVVVPLDERIGPFQVEIAERQSLLERALLAHAEAIRALEVWWQEEVTGAPDYDPEAPAPMPVPVLAVAQHIHDVIERTAAIVGGLQHQVFMAFGDEVQAARQHLMQDPALAGQAPDA